MNPNILPSKLHCYNKAKERLEDELRLIAENKFPGKNVMIYFAKRAAFLQRKIKELDDKYKEIL